MGVKSLISELQATVYKGKERQQAAKPDTEAETQRFTHPNQRMPRLVDWRVRCPGACWNFTAKTTPMPVVPAQSQENAVVADLLLVLTGVSGRYITPVKLSGDRNPRSFVIAEGLESCYSQIAKSVLPLVSAFSTVCRFAERKRNCLSGRVNHALAAGLERLCRDYLSVMARLSAEHRAAKLNLQSLYSKIQPYIYIFQTLSEVCERVGSNVRGGRTLSILSDAVRKSSGKAELLLQYLLETAAVPYMQQLHVWLTQGVVDDPYSEFLIEDNQVVVQKEVLPDEYSADYWQKCYTICKDRVPDFLDSYLTEILKTGKYLNVLRQCGINSNDIAIPELRFSCSENLYAERIREAHKAASSRLLKHLMVDEDLPGHLRSVRNYLLMAQGDFHTKFMDMAAHELDKDVNAIVPSRLQSLLELALRTSAGNNDPYKDLLRVDLHTETVFCLLKQISGSVVQEDSASKGWDALNFVYNPPWPVSLVLNPLSLCAYQLIFRHLVYCRHVERLLHRVWLEHKHRELWAAWDLRQRMLLYVHNLQYYMLVEVIEPQWNLLLQKLQEPTCCDLDEVLILHQKFESECLIKCMLTNTQHVEVLNTFLRKCMEFCSFMDACGLVEASPVHTAQPAVSFTQSESFSAKIAEFNKSFTQHVQYLFRTLRDSDAAHRSDKLMDMIYRLDFNSYYKGAVYDRSRDSIKSRDSGKSIHSNSSGW